APAGHERAGQRFTAQHGPASLTTESGEKLWPAHAHPSIITGHRGRCLAVAGSALLACLALACGGSRPAEAPAIRETPAGQAVPRPDETRVALLLGPRLTAA